ncbi:hypothetical protein [Oscillatoria sp. FACHB-1406]|uniref:hypothetical protein n=1 Tax=Oscillatoria sp. FACHB-1406 TaxID=2692846 RepID=UPI001684274F|nr:hypothetical protein [Oscillatoria sp. FACHB-1406]MBD2579850.1 hypothetical protein [Oscillatoria sp. FACHB-1406]
MYFSREFVEQLRQYLTTKSATGDEEARALLAKLEQLEREGTATQSFFVPPPGQGLGC